MQSEIKNNIERFFLGVSGLAAVFVFGSEARGRTSSHSDVDIAALFHPKFIPDIRRQLDIKEDLVSLLGREVDFVVLNRANPILRKQVLAHGEALLIRDKTQFGEFLVRSLTDYEDLKRIRAPIERAILKGRSYGE